MDYGFLAWRGLRHQPLRSFLTIIAIVVAIAAIFTLVSLILGLQETVRGELSKLGTNRITVIPGTMVGMNLGGDVLTEEDRKAIENTPGVKNVLALQTDHATISAWGEEKGITIFGVDPDAFNKTFQSLLGGYLESGRILDRTDRGRYVALIGYSVAHDLFGKDILPGSTVYINGKPFRVVGVMKKTNSPLDAGAYIPESVFQEITGREREYVRISAELAEGANVDDVVERIKRRLKALHGGLENFRVITPEQAMERANQILGMVGALLVTIAAISLVIGAVVIMNTMYMSVTERTREIGVMKAVGATKWQIMAIFLVEAGIIGAAGGLFGEIIGFGIVKTLEGVIRASLESYSAAFPSLLVLGLVGFSALVGVISGILPARSAAELDPVEAMRQ
ncbi:MAG: putative transport system permease protein [Candidatus Diapherotrites archaeon]|nr:putative transport system permease protein [Candidatus Diapherotrites archaeon]